MTPITLPAPSARLKELMDAERADPKYLDEDPDLANLHALEAVYEKHGDTIFDFTNPTDNILRMTLTEEAC